MALSRIQRGTPLTCDLVNRIIDEINRNAVNVAGGGGIEMAKAGAGKTLWVPPATSGLWIAKVATDIGPATSRTAPGSGTAYRYTSFDGTSLGGLSSSADTVYNYHDKTYKASPESDVLLATIYGALWVLDVWSCTGLYP